MDRRAQRDGETHRVDGALGPPADLVTSRTVCASTRRRTAAVLAAVCLALACCSRSHSPEQRKIAGAQALAYAWHLPRGFPIPIVPADNPMSDAKVALGRRLFYDTRLAGNGTLACAGCHQQGHGFTDGRAHAIGSTGASHPRSAMALANVAYNASFGWADGRTRTLEAQIAVPMFNEHPVELGLKGREAEIVQRFAAEPHDAASFRDAFPGDAPPIRFDHIVKALAAFERTLISGDSALDRYLYQDDKSGMSPAALRGMSLFFSDRLGCSKCHGGFNFSGPVKYVGSTLSQEPTFHNTALYNVDGRGGYPAADRGVWDVTHAPADMGRFRAPTLRNVALTAPYMHDGSVPTLEAAIAHYARAGVASPLRSPLIAGFAVTAAEVADLIAFLNALTDRAFVENPRLGAPGVAGSAFLLRSRRPPIAGLPPPSPPAERRWRSEKSPSPPPRPETPPPRGTPASAPIPRA